MGCGKSKPANVAAGNVMIKKKSSVTEKVEEQNVVADANEKAVKEAVHETAPVKTEENAENVEAAVSAKSIVVEAQVVNDEVKAAPELVENVEPAEVEDKSTEPEIVASAAAAADVKTAIVQPEEAEAAAAESNLSTENVQPEEKEVLVTESK